jgi:hypothetical protein
MVTFRETHPTAPIRPLWANASTITNLPTTNEVDVIAVPAYATPGNPVYRPDVGEYFRRYRLYVPLLQTYGIDGSNVWRTMDGSAIPIQLFRQRYTMIEGEDDGVMVAQPVSGQFELLQGDLDANTGIVTLAKPNIFLARTQPDPIDGAIVKLYARAELFVTATIASRALVVPGGSAANQDSPRGGYDTGVRRPGIDGLPCVGLTSTFVNSSLKVSMAGSKLGGVRDINGIAHEFGATVFDPIFGWLNLVPPGDPPLIEEDQRGTVAALAEQMLADNSRARSDVSVVIPAVAHYLPGDVVTVSNRGINNRRLSIQTVTTDYETISTTIQGSDGIPPVAALDRPARRR